MVGGCQGWCRLPQLSTHKIPSCHFSHIPTQRGSRIVVRLSAAKNIYSVASHTNTIFKSRVPLTLFHAFNDEFVGGHPGGTVVNVNASRSNYRGRAHVCVYTA